MEWSADSWSILDKSILLHPSMNIFPFVANSGYSSGSPSRTNCPSCRFLEIQGPPDWILRHFRESHKSIPLSTHQAISDYSKSLELVTPENLIIPTNPVEPIHGLVIVNGFQCQYTGCDELRSSETSVKQHCWKQHAWKAESGTM